MTTKLSAFSKRVLNNLQNPQGVLKEKGAKWFIEMKIAELQQKIQACNLWINNPQSLSPALVELSMQDKKRYLKQIAEYEAAFAAFNQ